MITTSSENPFVTPRRVIRLDYNLQEWLDWAEPAKAAAVLMIKDDDNMADTNLLKTLEALVAAYEAMPFINRYPLAENIEDIKAHVEKLRVEASADLHPEDTRGLVVPALRKYQVTIGADLRAYATVTVEAPDEDVAWNKARKILQILQDSMGKMVEFEADYQTLHDLELLEDLVDITDH